MIFDTPPFFSFFVMCLFSCFLFASFLLFLFVLFPYLCFSLFVCFLLSFDIVSFRHVGEGRYEGKVKGHVEDGFLTSWFVNQIIEMCEGAKELWVQYGDFVKEDDES
jgi:hypothetical protein